MSARSTASSVHALRVIEGGAAPKMVSGAMGQAGSREQLARLNAAVRELKSLAIEPLLHNAVKALERGDSQAGAEWAIKALEKDECSGFGWYLLGIARERVSDFANSVAAYETALKLLPDHAEIANDLGRLAYRMGMRPQAEKLFRHFLARYPDNPEGANNLACSIRDQGSLDEAIEVLRPAILRQPEQPMLWNTMGTIVAEQGDFETAQVFFEEAMKLDPRFAKARYNRGNARLALGDAAQALIDCDTAMKEPMTEDERLMMQLCRSTILLTLGRIGEGWDEYEARLSQHFSEVTHFVGGAPPWRPGMELAGRTLLVVGEQGLGDEVLFANTVPDLIERLGPAGTLKLAVEPRLISLFQRSFPSVEVIAHATYVANARHVRAAPSVENETIDLWAPFGSLLREFRREVADFPQHQGFLKPDAARIAHWREVLKQAPGGLKVGLLWKSAVKANARQRFYAQFADWAPVLKQAGVTFVNLQYGDCAPELARARDEFGVEIWQPPGIDLKQDLDDVAALSCALDLTLGFSNASFNLAAASGAPAWLLTVPGAWPRLGREDDYPWYPQVRAFAPKTYADWSGVMDELAGALAAFVAEH